MPQVVAEGRRTINNVERSASLLLIKTIFTCILVVICTVYILIGYSIFVDIQQYKLFTSYYTPNK